MIDKPQAGPGNIILILAYTTGSDKAEECVFKMHFIYLLQETKADKEIGWQGEGEQQSCI